MSQNALSLTRIGRTSIKELALDQLKRFIASGTLAAGQRLPSERELAERLGVGRNSIREALKVLEAIGLVESRVGEGTFITAPSGETIGRVIGLKLTVWGGTLVEVLEARQMIEAETARAAAEGVTVAETQALFAELQSMESAIDFKQYLAADMNFHRLVAQAARNRIVSRIALDLIDLLERVLHETQGDQLPTAVEGTASHRAVYEAIARRDPEAAGEAMRQHIRFSTELWQTIVSLGISARSEAVPDSSTTQPVSPLKPYPESVRTKVLEAIDLGTPRTEVAASFGISQATIKRYLRQRRETGNLAPKTSPGRPATKGVVLDAGLAVQLTAHPEASLEEHCAFWEASHDMAVSTATMSRAIARLGWTRIKGRWTPSTHMDDALQHRSAAASVVPTD